MENILKWVISALPGRKSCISYISLSSFSSVIDLLKVKITYRNHFTFKKVSISSNNFILYYRQLKLSIKKGWKSRMLIHPFNYTPASGEWCSRWARESVCDFHQQCLPLRYSPILPGGGASTQTNLIKAIFPRWKPILPPPPTECGFLFSSNKIMQLRLLFKELMWMSSF